MTADLLDYLGVASLVGEGRGLCGWGPWEQASSSEDATNVKKLIDLGVFLLFHNRYFKKGIADGRHFEGFGGWILVWRLLLNILLRH